MTLRLDPSYYLLCYVSQIWIKYELSLPWSRTQWTLYMDMVGHKFISHTEYYTEEILPQHSLISLRPYLNRARPSAAMSSPSPRSSYHYLIHI